MSKYNKGHRALWFLGIVVGLLVLLFCFSVYKADLERIEITRILSEDEAYTLYVYQIGEPEFPYGEVNCRLVLKQGHKKLASVRLSLKNDGKNLGEDQFWVEFHEAGAEVHVLVEEQPEQLVNLSFTGTVETVSCAS